MKTAGLVADDDIAVAVIGGSEAPPGPSPGGVSQIGAGSRLRDSPG